MWSRQQEEALSAVNRWLKDPNRKPYFQLAGFAGTGKTTLAKHLAEGVRGSVLFAAYTGKAAHVLEKAGCPNVSTIHRLIYQPKERSQHRLKELETRKAMLESLTPRPERELQEVAENIAKEKVNLARPMFQLNLESEVRYAGLVVVDEYSMIGQQMGNDLLGFGVPILALGDPAQLPPVQEQPYFTEAPDIMLTEIHRQAAGNPIIAMSKDVREGKALRPGSYGDSRVLTYGEEVKKWLAEKVLSADQLLVGRNATRQSSNARVRELLGRDSKLPQKGDKLVCLRNNPDVGLFNGQIWYASEDALMLDDFVELALCDEDERSQIDTIAHSDYFHGSQPEWYAKRDADEFDYGYALTVHKAQGSQWGDVLLLDEWRAQHRKEWLYTAITRASDRITVVQM